MGLEWPLASSLVTRFFISEFRSASQATRLTPIQSAIGNRQSEICNQITLCSGPPGPASASTLRVIAGSSMSGGA